ncbi:LysR family transcriptional regulator [Vibrio maritimus]
MQSLDQVIAFVSVYESQSYSAAGRALRKDRTTVRELVKAYEDQLGFALFIIVGKKANPTERATKLYPQAKLVLRQNQILQEFGQAMFLEPKVELTVGYDSDFPIEFIKELEYRCLETFPHIRVHWLETTRVDGLSALSNHKLDVAVLPAKGKVTPEFPFTFKHLGHISYAPFAHPKNGLVAKDSFSLEDSHFEVQYLLENHLRGEGIIQGFSHHARVVSNHALLVDLLVNGGWALLPLHIGHHYVRLNKVKKLKANVLARDIKVPYSLFYLTGGESQPITQALIDWFTELSVTYLS